MTGPNAIDPVSLEVMRNAFVETTEEMTAALRRSAYSTNIKTRCDFSCAIFDSKCNVIAQSFSQANHLGSLVKMIPLAVEQYAGDKLPAGSAIVTNDPFQGGVHLNDIAVIAPVYFQDTLWGYVANLAHHVDVGGGAPASVGAFQEVYQEGVIIPPVLIMENNAICEDVFRLILSQIRSKRETAGDFRAQIAANQTGIRRLTGLLDRYGQEFVNFYSDELQEYSDRMTQKAMKRLPFGDYRAEGVVDSDGFTDEPVKLVSRVVINEQGVLFDFTGCDLQRAAPVNSTHSMTYAAAAYVLRCIIEEDVPINAGFYRSVRMIAPENTVINCLSPAPVVGGWETHVRLVDVVFRALAQAIPDKVPAGTKAMICHAGFGGINPRTGEYYCFLETLGGGYGGRATIDGPDAVQAHGQNTENAPIEETESNYPIRITRYELVEDSEGAGCQRGGLGVRRDYQFIDHHASFTVLADRDRWGPWGLFGGSPGKKASYLLNPDGEARFLGSKTTVALTPGDVVSYRTCGGGGYGPPENRHPDKVLNDVLEGKISLSRARDVYRVAIDPDSSEINHEQTEHYRGHAES